MFLVLLASILAVASAQTFSFGALLGGPNDGLAPSFDSQRAPGFSLRQNPFTSFSAPEPVTRSRGSAFNFEDFFSSSRLSTGTPERQRSSSPVQSSSGSLRSRTDSTSAPAIPPQRTIERSRGTPVAATRTPAPARREPVASVPAPFRSAPAVAAPVPSRSRTADTSRFPAGGVVRATPQLSSRGRIQEDIPEAPEVAPIARPVPQVEQADVRDNLVGQSVCARGTSGDACREHLAITAMACTSGFCQECQQCGTMSADKWPKCCREHNLCCRPLARACQGCDKPSLFPFCRAAFGRCHN